MRFFNFGQNLIKNLFERELLGHSNISQTSTYVHTSAARMREAVRKRDRIDYNSELEKLFDEVKKDMLDLSGFTNKIKELFHH